MDIFEKGITAVFALGTTIIGSYLIKINRKIQHAVSGDQVDAKIKSAIEKEISLIEKDIKYIRYSLQGIDPKIQEVVSNRMSSIEKDIKYLRENFEKEIKYLKELLETEIKSRNVGN